MCKKSKGKRRTKRKQVKGNVSSSDDTDVALSNLCNDDEDDDVENEDLCAVCGEFGRDREMWYRCCNCCQWIHKECSGKDSAENYICDMCN